MVIFRRKRPVHTLLTVVLGTALITLVARQVVLYTSPYDCDCTPAVERSGSLSPNVTLVKENTDVVNSSCSTNISALHSKEQNNLTKSNENVTSEEVIKPLRLLSWTAMSMTDTSHSDPWFGDGSDSTHAFQRCYDGGYIDPKLYPCHYTSNRKYMAESEVVLFRGRRMPELPLPMIHPVGQLWLFYEFEPPYKTWQYTNLTRYNGVFNLTSTYTRDSDVPFLFEIKTCIKQQMKYPKLSKIDYMAKKKRQNPVAWFASVCRTQSKREQYVKELQKHIGVDIYGKCGNLKCGGNIVTEWDQQDCDKDLLHGNYSYMFYLAFENSLCDDYISEKLWRMLKLDIIPIVMGAVDYSNIMPKDSFIDVRNFNSPKRLAEYLHRLMANRDKYNEYIRNKNILACKSIEKYMPRECSMCKMLHNLRGHQKVVYNLDNFWGRRRCTDPEDYFKKIPNDQFDLTTQIKWPDA